MKINNKKGNIKIINIILKNPSALIIASGVLFLSIQQEREGFMLIILGLLSYILIKK